MKKLWHRTQSYQALEKNRAFGVKLPISSDFRLHPSLPDSHQRSAIRKACGGRLQAHFKSIVRNQQSKSGGVLILARSCGVAVPLLYLIRGTVLPWFLPFSLTALISGALILTTGVTVLHGGKWRWSWIMVMLVFALSISQAEEPEVAALHWVGLVLLIFSVGPVVINPVATELRSVAWRITISGMFGLTAIFLLWYVFRLPNFGKGFSAFMYQCMLLGPIAGLGVLIALARAIDGRSWKWSLCAALGIIPVLASGSRVATLATIAGVCFLLIREKPILGVGVLVLCATLISSFVSRGRNLEASTESLTGAMARKGDLNSRAGRWESRLLEFQSSPTLGIGIAMATGEGGEKDLDGRTWVEPGSSYLALLAMTGVLGTTSFIAALGLLLLRFTSIHRVAWLDKAILIVVGIFLAAHGVAEGWILSYGSPLCFLFWLWLGCVGDYAAEPFDTTRKLTLRLAHWNYK